MNAKNNYLLRLEIELEGLKLTKKTNRVARSEQERNAITNQNIRAERKEFLQRKIKQLKSQL